MLDLPPVSVQYLKVCVIVCKRGETSLACQTCQPVSDYGTQGGLLLLS